MSIEAFRADLDIHPEHNVPLLHKEHFYALQGKGWTPQQITRFAPQIAGLAIGQKAGGTADIMKQYAHGSSLLNPRSGLLGMGAATHYIGAGRDFGTIKGHGLGIAGSRAGRGGAWEGGFTPQAAQYVRDHFQRKETEEIRKAEQVAMDMQQAQWDKEIAAIKDVPVPYNKPAVIAGASGRFQQQGSETASRRRGKSVKTAWSRESPGQKRGFWMNVGGAKPQGGAAGQQSQLNTA